MVKELCRKSGKAHILAVARSAVALQELAEECHSIHPEANVVPMAFDLAEKGQCDTLLQSIPPHMNVVDLLINNAGNLVSKPFEKMSENDVLSVFSVNFFAVVQLTRRLLPLLKRSETPHIVNIGSMGGFQGSDKFPGLSVYSASKAALACLSECLSVELRDDGIAVNCLALGGVDTAMLREAFPDYRAGVNADTMAEFIAHFALHGHRLFNGKVLPVAGNSI